MDGPLPDAHVEHLANLLRANQLVVFVGAGISHQAPTLSGSSEKLPLWQELAAIVAKHCGEDPKSYGNNILDLFDAIEANRSRGDLEEAVRLAIPDARFQPSASHYELAKSPWYIIVTTNYDTLLQRVLHEQNPIDDEASYDWLARPKPPRLIHIHGTLSSLHTLSGRDFIDWPTKHPRAYAYLEHLALNKTILFAGYSFSDPHLKNGLLPWIQQAMAGRGKRHFAWMWDITPEQVKLFDKRDKIDAFPIRNDSDWEAAFRQLAKLIGQHSLPFSPSRRRVRSPQPAPDQDSATVNGYKLFFHRNRHQWSARQLSIQSGVDAQLINDVEQVRTTVSAGPHCFKAIKRTDLAKIEHALQCIGQLEYGRGDDFLATYIMFYQVNKPSRRKKKIGTTRSLDFRPDTKAVVFDFGGTLTRSTSPLSTWERMWHAVGYSTADAGNHLRRFIAKKITHQQWCDVTATRLRERAFSRNHLKEIAQGIKPVDGIRETLVKLRDQGTALYIVSGSVKEIIVEILGENYSLFSEIRANEMNFGEDGVIKSIKGHQFDFEGKADFIRRVIDDQGCSPLDVLFVGNSLNDTWASQSGARTLCVNPADVDFTNTFVWTDYIREMSSLTESLPYAQRSQASDIAS
jgi:phosphoserine phosphatase